MDAEPESNRWRLVDPRRPARLDGADVVDHLRRSGRWRRDDGCGAHRVRVGEQGQRFSGEQWRMSGEVDQGGDALDQRGGRRTRVDPAVVGVATWCPRGGLHRVAVDFGSRGEVADAVKDPGRAIEMGGGDGGAIGGRQPPGHPRRFSDHLEGRVGIGAKGFGHHDGAFVGSSYAPETLRRQQLHPLQEVPIGHALDGGQRIEREGESGGGVAGAIEPFDAG